MTAHADTLQAELPELCRWVFLHVAPEESPGMLARHLAGHVRQRELLLQEMAQAGPEGAAWAELAREWLGQDGQRF